MMTEDEINELYRYVRLDSSTISEACDTLLLVDDSVHVPHSLRGEIDKYLTYELQNYKETYRIVEEEIPYTEIVEKLELL